VPDQAKQFAALHRQVYTIYGMYVAIVLADILQNDRLRLSAHA
jgi:hypothetical protein